MTIYSRANPFHSRVLHRILLNKPGSTKENYHVTLDLKGSGICYEVGSSIAVLPENHPHLVQEYLHYFGATGEEKVLDPRSNLESTFREFLTHKVNFFRLTSGQIKKIKELESLFEHPETLSSFLSSHEPLDILKKYNSYTIEEWIKECAPLLPRFYSISSSPHTSSETVDLLVSHLTFLHREDPRYGVASHFLCKSAELLHTKVPLYVQKAPHFKLPQDPETSLIMIGPGTGVAPYRGFLQEREALSSPGKNWLFFGDRHREFDFLYEDFWNRLASQGKLILESAFSRDQTEKCYVQHKLYSHKKELWAWIQEGAHLYICGDAKKMAKDVEAILLKIFEEEGSFTEEQSRLYLKQLRSEKRYLLDVY